MSASRISSGRVSTGEWSVSIPSYGYTALKYYGVRLLLSNLFFPLRRKYIASNFTLKGLESRGIELPEGSVDKDLIVDDALILPMAPDDESPAVEMYLHNELFTYDECHKVLADGRIVEVDPVTGKWSRRPAAVAKELWNRLPNLQA